MQFGPWIQFQIPGINTRVLARRGRQALALLKHRGLRLAVSNRLERAIALLDELNDGRIIPTESEPEVQTRSLEALRTVFEGFVVLWTLTQRPRSTDVFPNQRLKSLLEGAETIEADKNPWARNTQFELIVGAAMVLGGATIVPEEPDYRFLYHGDWVGLPVKRLTSTSQAALRAALRDAAGQLQRARLRGFVAVNLDSWISDLGVGTAGEVGQRFNEQLRGAHRELQNQSEREVLLGALVYGQASKWVFGSERPSIEWRTGTQHLTFRADPEDWERARQYFEPLQERLARGMEELGQLLA